MPRRLGDSRSNYYDRNIIPNYLSYQAATIAPHAATTRATYTLPSSRVSITLSSNLNVIRDAVATTSGQARATVQNNGNTNVILEAIQLSTGTGAIGDKAFASGSTLGFLYTATQTTTIVTADASTAGTFTYRLSVVIIEYDP